MLYLLFIPIILQASALFFDEFYYHWKRGLPLWERVGHPIDTLSVITCFALTLFLDFSISSLFIFIGFASFSTFLVTKDEFVHAKQCLPAEMWLHSILFVLHPIVFLSLGFLWFLSSISYELWPPAFNNVLNIGPEDIYFSLQMQTTVVSLFCLYQIIYWSFIWQPKQK